MNLLAEATEQVTAVPTWSWLGPLVGVIAGGLLGGASQAFIEHRRHRYERQRELMRVRREVYFRALEVVDGMGITIDDFVNALSGRRNEEDVDTEEGREESRARDEAGAAALGQLVTDRRAVHTVVTTVAAVGSTAVRTAMGAVSGAVDDYMADLGEQIATDGVFRGAAASAFQERYEDLSERLSASIRADLDVDRLVNEKL